MIWIWVFFDKNCPSYERLGVQNENRVLEKQCDLMKGIPVNLAKIPSRVSYSLRWRRDNKF